MAAIAWVLLFLNWKDWLYHLSLGNTGDDTSFLLTFEKILVMYFVSKDRSFWLKDLAFNNLATLLSSLQELLEESFYSAALNFIHSSKFIQVHPLFWRRVLSSLCVFYLEILSLEFLQIILCKKFHAMFVVPALGFTNFGLYVYFALFFIGFMNLFFRLFHNFLQLFSIWNYFFIFSSLFEDLLRLDTFFRSFFICFLKIFLQWISIVFIIKWLQSSIDFC